MKIARLVKVVVAAGLVGVCAGCVTPRSGGVDLGVPVTSGAVSQVCSSSDNGYPTSITLSAPSTNEKVDKLEFEMVVSDDSFAGLDEETMASIADNIQTSLMEEQGNVMETIKAEVEDGQIVVTMSTSKMSDYFADLDEEDLVFESVIPEMESAGYSCQ